MLLIPSLKKKTKQAAIQRVNDPIDFYLPLDVYRGTMESLVEVGQKIFKYQCIAQLRGVFATTLHAPASGIIKEILLIDGKPHIHLENDFKDKEAEIFAPNSEKLTIEDFAEILAEFGIEGSGGSRFPTQMKYRFKEKPIETLIFNGVECEPYLSADAVLMREKSYELVKTANVIKNIVKAKRVVFVLEKQNADIKRKLRETAENLGIPIEFCIVPDTYPQGGELQVIKSVMGVELKKGELPMSHGILLNNVGTLWAIHQALFEGKPYVERVLTVSGNKTENQGNYWVKIGTPVSHVLNKTQNSRDMGEQLIVLGGAMMGKAVNPQSATIHKGSGGILVLKRQKSNEQNCIKCGECVDVCPQHLMPFEFVRHVSDGNLASLNTFNLQSCIECGACAYTCPSNVPLMQSIFKGKKMLTS